MLELLKQRRILSSIFGVIAFLLAMSGYAGLDVTGATDATLKIVEGVSAIIAIVLPVISYLKPKLK